jgi:hypothetical protein
MWRCGERHFLFCIYSSTSRTDLNPGFVWNLLQSAPPPPPSLPPPVVTNYNLHWFLSAKFSSYQPMLATRFVIVRCWDCINLVSADETCHRLALVNDAAVNKMRFVTTETMGQ